MDRVHGDFRRGKAVISHDASQRVERVCCPLVKLGAPHIRRVRVKDIFVACLLGIRFVKEGCGGWNRSDDKPSFCRVTVDALNKDWRTNGQTVVCRGGDKNTRAALVNFDAQNIQCFVVVPGEECRDIVDKLQILPSCCLQTILKIGVDEIHGVADAKFANRVYQTLYCRIVTLDESPNHCVHHMYWKVLFISLSTARCPCSSGARSSRRTKWVDSRAGTKQLRPLPLTHQEIRASSKQTGSVYRTRGPESCRSGIRSQSTRYWWETEPVCRIFRRRMW